MFGTMGLYEARYSGDQRGRGLRQVLTEQASDTCAYPMGLSWSSYRPARHCFPVARSEQPAQAVPYPTGSAGQCAGTLQGVQPAGARCANTSEPSGRMAMRR